MAGIRRHPPGFGSKAPPGGPPPNEGTFHYGVLSTGQVYGGSLIHVAVGYSAGDSPYTSPDNPRMNANGVSAVCGWRVKPNGGASNASNSGIDERFAAHAYDQRASLLSTPQWFRLDPPYTPIWLRWHLAAGRKQGSGAIRSWGHEIYGTEQDAIDRTNVKQKVTGFDWSTAYSVVDAEGTDYPDTTGDTLLEGRGDWINASRDGGVGVPLFFDTGEYFVMRVYPDGTAAASFTAYMSMIWQDLVP